MDVKLHSKLTDHTFRKILSRAGESAKLQLESTSTHVKTATGFKLANDGNDTRSIQLYLGHRAIQNTMRYTELSSKRFDMFWDD